MQHLLAHFEPAAEEDGNEEWMIFLNALVHRTGSTAAAGKALQELLQRQEGQTDADSALHAWATALVKPDRATGGGDFKKLVSRPRDRLLVIGVRCCGSSFVPGMLVVVVTLFTSSCPGLIANSSNCHMQFLNTLDCVGLKRRQSTYFLLDSPN